MLILMSTEKIREKGRKKKKPSKIGIVRNKETKYKQAQKKKERKKKRKKGKTNLDDVFKHSGFTQFSLGH